MSERQKIFVAIVLSLLLHVFAFGFLMVWTWFMPEAVAQPKLPPPASQVVVTIVPPKPKPKPVAVATPKPEPKIQRSELDTEGLAKAEKPPEKPLFEAAENSRAASELPATGSAPLPSQMGKERPAPEFASHDFSLGKGAGRTAAEATQPKSAQQNSEPKPTPAPTPAELPKPTPVATPTPAATQVELPKPTPIPAPKNTPPPPNAFALNKPTPAPVATPQPSASPTPIPDELPKPTPVSTPKPMERLAMLNTQPTLRAPTNEVRRTPSEPGYQAQKEKTKIEGSISNRGKSGVDAVGTPLGLYRKRVADAIGSRWYYYVNQRMDLITVGDVHIKFTVNPDGHVADVKILSNTANELFGQFCVQSVTEARIPPLPPDVATSLQNGKLEIEYHFTIYPN